MNFWAIIFLKNTKNIYTFWNVHFWGLCFLRVRSRVPCGLIQNLSWFRLWSKNEKNHNFYSDIIFHTVSETFILGVYVVFGWDPVDKRKTSHDSDCGSKKRENSSEFQLGHNVFKIFWSTQTTENISLSETFIFAFI